MKKLKRENLAEHLIEYQLNLIELTTLDALFNKDWIKKWSLTEEQHNIWKKYCIKTIKEVLKINSVKAKKTFEWLNLGYGLKISDKRQRILPRTGIPPSRERGIFEKRGEGIRQITR